MYRRYTSKDEGEIIIQSKQIDHNDLFLQTYGYVNSGKHVLISISDNGCGMKKEIQDKIFDPFFTTKPSGQGTGLGLSMAFGIIKRHNGFIDVKSCVEEGSTFNIYLPMA